MAGKAANSIKDELAKRAESAKGETKLTKSMGIADLIKAMAPEIKKALPDVITPDLFTRMALSALNTTPIAEPAPAKNTANAAPNNA